MKSKVEFDQKVEIILKISYKNSRQIFMFKFAVIHGILNFYISYGVKVYLTKYINHFPRIRSEL